MYKIYLNLFMHHELSFESYMNCLISFLQMSILCGQYYYESHFTFAEIGLRGVKWSVLSYKLRKGLVLIGIPSRCFQFLYPRPVGVTRVILPPESIWQCLEQFLFVTAGETLLAPSGLRPRMQHNIRQCTGQPPPQNIIQQKCQQW